MKTMSCSKITTKTKKPLGWWYHKIMCEFEWYIYKKFDMEKGHQSYCYHLNKMVEKYNINLYGEINSFKIKLNE